MRRVFALSVGVLMLASTAYSQDAAASTEAPKVPELTEVQRLRLQVSAQAAEIAQLRLELAARAFESARAAWTEQLAAAHVDGFTLDLERMVYVPVQVPETKEAVEP